MDELIPGERASRDFRVKFPDDVIQDNLAGQLWFGAEVINNNNNTDYNKRSVNPATKNVKTVQYCIDSTENNNCVPIL